MRCAVSSRRPCFDAARCSHVVRFRLDVRFSVRRALSRRPCFDAVRCSHAVRVSVAARAFAHRHDPPSSSPKTPASYTPPHIHSKITLPSLPRLAAGNSSPPAPHTITSPSPSLSRSSKGFLIGAFVPPPPPPPPPTRPPPALAACLSGKIASESVVLSSHLHRLPPWEVSKRGQKGGHKTGVDGRRRARWAPPQHPRAGSARTYI